MLVPDAKAVDAPEGQHIFNARQMTETCLRWKQLTEAGRHAEAQEMLEEIIVGCTNMFERLAQSEGFTKTVDLETLVQAAREKVVRWLIGWDKKRSLFSYFSVCAKNAFLSEVNKTNSHRRRFHATSETLEKFFGAEDHAANKHDAAREAKRRLQEITIRWGDPQEAAAVRLAIDCLVDDREQDREAAVRTICFAYALSPELGRFFYSWGLFALRDAMLDRAYIPFTREDLLRHKYSYTHLPDLLNIVSWRQFQTLVATLGGQRLRIPTMAQLARLHENHLMARRIEKLGADVAAVEAAAKEFGRSPKSAQEIYEEVMREMDQNRAGEHYLYEQPDE
jgi:DNA-directed RNA polymerase specialized sigma24 family protein